MSDAVETGDQALIVGSIWSVRTFRREPLRYVARGIHILFRYLFGLFFAAATANKFMTNWLFSDIVKQIFEQRLTQLHPESFAAIFLENFALPLYLPIAWIVTWTEFAVTIGLLFGIAVRPMAGAAFLLLFSFAIGGYYDASLLPFFMLCVVFMSYPSGRWVGFDRRLHEKYPESIWFK